MLEKLKTYWFVVAGLIVAVAYIVWSSSRKSEEPRTESMGESLGMDMGANGYSVPSPDRAQRREDRNERLDLLTNPFGNNISHVVLEDDES